MDTNTQEWIDTTVERMMDALPYHFADIAEWNAFRDRLWDMVAATTPERRYVPE